MKKNFSQRTTAAIGNFTIYVRDDLLQERLHYIWVASFLVVMACLPLTGCRQDSHTIPLSSESLTQESPFSSLSDDKTTTDFQYLSKGELTPVEVVPPPAVIGSPVKIDEDRLITIAGEVNDRMFIHANRLAALAEQDNDPIDIVISSPGGSIPDGLLFIEAMTVVKTKGIKLRCHVPTVAASMAFVIFTQCQERYALPYARLLFHSPRIEGKFMITTQSAIQLARSLSIVEAMLLEMIQPVMGIGEESEEWFYQSYLSERLFLAAELLSESPKPWFKVVSDIRGYPGPFPSYRSTK